MRATLVRLALVASVATVTLTAQQPAVPRPITGQDIASGLTGFGLGWILKTYGWDGTPYVVGSTPANASVWVFSIIPFSVLGALIMTRIWHAKPQRHGGH